MKRFALSVAVVCTLGATGLHAQEHRPEDQRSSGGAVQYPLAEESSEREAMGVLGAGTVYLAYLTLGSVYDNFTAGTYDRETTKSIVLSVQHLIDTSLKKVQTVADETGDDDVLAGLTSLYNALQSEASSLLGFIRSGSERDRKSFQEERARAWQKIAAALGLD